MFSKILLHIKYYIIEFMFGGWFKFCKEWWDDASANDSILILTYESCKKVHIIMLFPLQFVYHNTYKMP